MKTAGFCVNCSGSFDFQIHDETYGGYFTSSSVHVLPKTNHPKNDPPIAWTTRYGNSRIFYPMLGHDRHAWKEMLHEHLPELLKAYFPAMTNFID